ncbi:1,4-alpha-glucan branching protein domain-containing protein [Paenibacillus sp. GCM10023250]|uniref:1,4-alpha-glucan branching protein domain-containing protein n=1 Tax=Paenibacillus sp. GCM10023250 TaxID=3252648 RepID=UPI0036093C1F
MDKGFLSIVLHAHLPFAPQAQPEGSPEERRLFEAATDVMLPLLDVLDGLARDRVPARLALSLSPALLSMLSDPPLQARYRGYLDRLIRIAEPDTRVRAEADKLRQARTRLTDIYGGNLVAGFKALADAGRLELLTSAATHAFLPYLRTEQALRAQIGAAVRAHAALLGTAPAGIWLPGGGYADGIDRVLRECGLGYCIVEAHSFRYADPQPSGGLHAPVRTLGGMLAFARDPETDREDFPAAWAGRAEAARPGNGKAPVVTACFDLLSASWRRGGAARLDRLCRTLAEADSPLAPTSPGAYLQAQAGTRCEECRPSFASAGSGGYGDAWLNGANQWIYRRLHEMEAQMIELADRHPDARGLVRRALDQAARELLLAQDGDLALRMGDAGAKDEAERRFGTHAARFRALRCMLRGGILDERWLARVERRDAAFPALDYRLYGTGAEVRDLGDRVQAPAGRALRVLMLAWEYPPFVVGGLSRHVHDLSRKLAEEGTEVHVVTCRVDGRPAYERDGGVHVHRLRTYQHDGQPFMDWIFQLNLAMADYAAALIGEGAAFDLVHAHDWLVHQAAKTLKHRFGLPLVATIHATEHGRNQGIRTWLQRTIHHREWELCYEAWRVIVCSQAMERELRELFAVPADKLDVIPNGVEPALSQAADDGAADRAALALPHEKIVFFVGRLVREKGVHVLLESAPEVLAACPEAKFVIAGKGPMLVELRARAAELGIGDKVHFAGFIDDAARSRLLRAAYAAAFPSLYEPFGIVALEAMAARVPVVVSGTGGLAEIVADGEDGYTALPGDAHSLASRLILLLRDERSAAAMAERALRKTASVYGWGGIAERTASVYRRVLREQSQLYYSREAAAAIEPVEGSR